MSAPRHLAHAIPADVLAVCQRLRDAGHEAHLVGGGVRDLLLGRTPKDFDVATDAHPDRVMALFGNRFAIPTGLEHGTVTVLAGTEAPYRPVEVTTFRGEGEYLDGRRPSSVTFGASLVEDLARRDFTMNAIALDPGTGTVTDPFHGQDDLFAGLVRAVRDPVERFTEDGLRPMRAVRQATQLGFTIEPTTLAAIRQTLPSFRKVSAERIRDELWKLLGAPSPSTGVALMRETGLLAEVLPEVAAGVGVDVDPRTERDAFSRTLVALDATPPDPRLRVTVLLAGAVGPTSLGIDVARRLRLSNEDRALVAALLAKKDFTYAPEWTDGAVRRFVRDVGPAVLVLLFALREAELAARAPDDPLHGTLALRDRIAALDATHAPLGAKDLAIDGRDVMKLLGAAPGRLVGRVLDALVERVLDDPTLNTRERLLALIPGVVATLGAS